MPSKKEGLIVIYPDYFRKGLSRKQGRRVPKHFSIEEPSLDKLNRLCKKMGYAPTMDETAAHPQRWHAPTGRILVRKDLVGMSKQELLMKLGERMAKGAEASREQKKGRK